MTEESLQSAGIPVLEKNEAPSLPTALDSTVVDPEPKSDPQKDAMHSPQARSFAGQKLHPFDWRRQEAAEGLGLKFFKLQGEVADEFEDTERYDGMAGDAVIVVWLCTLAPGQVAKAIRLPGQATEHRLKWAEKHIGGIGRAAHGDMMEIYGEILGSYINSLSEPTTAPGKPEGEDL